MLPLDHSSSAADLSRVTRRSPRSRTAPSRAGDPAAAPALTISTAPSLWVRRTLDSSSAQAMGWHTSKAAIAMHFAKFSSFMRVSFQSNEFQIPPQPGALASIVRLARRVRPVASVTLRITL